MKAQGGRVVTPNTRFASWEANRRLSSLIPVRSGVTPSPCLPAALPPPWPRSSSAFCYLLPPPDADHRLRRLPTDHHPVPRVGIVPVGLFGSLPWSIASVLLVHLSRPRTWHSSRLPIKLSMETEDGRFLTTEIAGNAGQRCACRPRTAEPLTARRAPAQDAAFHPPRQRATDPVIRRGQTSLNVVKSNGWGQSASDEPVPYGFRTSSCLRVRSYLRAGVLTISSRSPARMPRSAISGSTSR